MLACTTDVPICNQLFINKNVSPNAITLAGKGKRARKRKRRCTGERDNQVLRGNTVVAGVRPVGPEGGGKDVVHCDPLGKEALALYCGKYKKDGDKGGHFIRRSENIKPYLVSEAIDTIVKKPVKIPMLAKK